MYMHRFIYFLLLSFGYAQSNSEFWWRNGEFVTYSGLRPHQPKFENLNQIDTNEDEKILFKDNEPVASQRIDINRKGPINMNLPDESKVIFGTTTMNYIEKQQTSKDGRDPANIYDKLIIKFPENYNHFMWKSSTNPTSTVSLDITENEILSEKKSSSNIFLIMVFPYTHHQEKSSKSIFSFMKKIEWKPNDGFQSNTINYEKGSSDLVCCIIPLKNKTEVAAPQIYYPDEFEKIKRFKRSDKIAQKQRNVLIKHRYADYILKEKPERETKIATAMPDYEYDDPYWNIRNVKRPNNKRPDASTIYSTEDYTEDYSVELPRPGLTGIYSDHGKPFHGWKFSNSHKGSTYDSVEDVDDYDDGLSSFGYSTIDPRIEISTRLSKRPIKPMKITTQSEALTYDGESHTISYHATPDFKVLQDFKLLNLQRDNSRLSITSKSATTKSISESDSQETVLNSPLEANSGDNEDIQVAKYCRRTAIPVAFRIEGKQTGDTENGSHPWLALLVPRRNLKDILCYASIIHTRAAVTAADCVNRSQNKLALIFGLWHYNDRMPVKTRTVSTHLHPKYKDGELSNNLALLHWNRPLKLEANVHPVCLNKPHMGDNCIFVGWGGFDQAMRIRSRWQRATIHTCNDRLSLNGVNIPSEAFCASVRSPTTVTGLGGSLVCNVNGHVSAVGVAVSRDSTLVLLPVYDWVIQAIEVLHE